jgi:hypothetical protein
MSRSHTRYGSRTRDRSNKRRYRHSAFLVLISTQAPGCPRENTKLLEVSVPMKTQICCDLHPTGDSRLVPEAQIGSVISGCYKALLAIGNLSQYVSVVIVQWVKLEGQREYGPVVSFLFVEILEQTGSHTSDHRFFGKGTVNPSPDDIADHFSKPNVLPMLISKHLTKCLSAAADFKTKAEALKSTPPS